MPRRCGLLSKLDAVTMQPAMSALDQTRKCLPESLDGSTNLLGIDIRRCVLQPALEDVQLVQQRCLFFAQPIVGDKRLEDLACVWATVREQANQTRAGAGLENLDIGIERRRVIACDDHRAVGVSGLDGLEGGPPLSAIELASEALFDREVEGLAVLVDGLEEARQPSLLGRKRTRADPFRGVIAHPRVSSSIARFAPAI